MYMNKHLEHAGQLLPQTKGPRISWGEEEAVMSLSLGLSRRQNSETSLWPKRKNPEKNRGNGIKEVSGRRNQSRENWASSISICLTTLDEAMKQWLTRRFNQSPTLYSSTEPWNGVFGLFPTLIHGLLLLCIILPSFLLLRINALDNVILH